MRIIVSLLFVGLLSAQDPFPPAGGWGVGLVEYEPGGTNGPHTWVDGVVTALDVRYPLAPAPVAGWPVVLLIHGTEGTHELLALVQRGELLASVGYVCLAYDVRGKGVTTSANPSGFDQSEGARLRDMAELILRAGALVPVGVTVDASRVAVTGESMGGQHSFRAAGWSGQALTAPLGVYTHMPTISAIAPRLPPLDVARNSVPYGPLLIHTKAAVSIAEFGPSDPLHPFLVAEDFVPIRAMIAADPLRHYLPRLLTSSVPMLITAVWSDGKHDLAAPTIDALAQLPASTPVRTYWTTNGHSSPSNTMERTANDESIRRWFDHYVKSRNNGVDTEPAHESGYPPPTNLATVDPSSHWSHALETSWPPPTTTTTLYLHSAGPVPNLTNAAPTVAEPGVVIDHVLTNPNYDILAFGADDGSPAPVMANIALDNESFTSQPLPAELEILGRARLDLSVDANAGDFLLTACLYCVQANGNRRLITAGTHGVRGGTAGVHAVTIELDDIAFLVPAGYRLELALRNLALFDFPGGHQFLRTAPMFVPSTVSVRIDPATPARLGLPTRPRSHAFLTPRFATISASAGVRHDMRVLAGASRAGQYYLTLLGGSGFGPGAVFAPEVLPLNIDVWTIIAVGAPIPPFFPGFSGFLDAGGNAAAAVDLTSITIPPIFLGQRWTCAVLGLDGGGYWVGGPAEFEIVP